MNEGDMDAGGWSCGMVVGLIHDVPAVKELIDWIMAEAEEIIRHRLGPLLAHAPQRLAEAVWAAQDLRARSVGSRRRRHSVKKPDGASATHRNRSGRHAASVRRAG
jgi:hypothetical protein